MIRIKELNRRRWLRAGLERLDWHIQNSEHKWDHQLGGTLPRVHMWRRFRFCVQDVVLGLTVLRHNRRLNCLEVDVFLTASIPEYEVDSGARALALFVLSEAYKCGGTMEVRFTREVELGKIPIELVELAAYLGVFFEAIDDGIIAPKEAIRLYAALTGFSQEMQKRLEDLHHTGRISSAMTCYAIHHGVWDRREVEAILLTCPWPGNLLSGLSKPEQRHLYAHDQAYGQAALLFGSLDRNLRYRAHAGDQGNILLEDDERSVDVHISGLDYAVTFRCDQEPIQIPWVVATSGNAILSPGQSLTVLVRARGELELELFLKDDFRVAAKLQMANPGNLVYVLVPRDFEKLESSMKAGLLESRPEGVGLMVYREYLASLNELVERKLKTSGVMRA